MSDNKKYYYLKLKDNFFDDERIKIMESMPNGIYYTNLLLKLYLRSLKSNGQLRFTKTLPYDENMIATITNLNIDIVRVGIKVLIELQLIEKLDDGTIFMSEIQNFIGKSSTEADRMRAYRNEIEQKKIDNANVQKIDWNFDDVTNVQNYYNKCNENTVTNVGEISNICTPEKEIDIKIDIYKQKQLKITQYKNNVNKKVVVDENIKIISEKYSYLTGRYTNYRDIESMVNVLEYSVTSISNNKSKVNIILKVLEIVYSQFKTKNPDDEIKSFNYFVKAIKNEYKKIETSQKVRCIGKNDKNKSNYTTESGERIDFNNFSDN